MDFIFDEDVDEVGAEIEAFCPKCKADTTHVVISKYEDEIRRVQCNACGDVHPFRKPRGEAEEDSPAEPVAAKKRAAKVKPTWEQVMAKPKKEPKLYLIAQTYKDNELIGHPKFGPGFVSEVIPPDKIEVTFQSGRRILIHNRSGMSLPPAAYSHPVDITFPVKPAAKAGSKTAAKPVESKVASKPVTQGGEKKPAAATGKPADKKGATAPAAVAKPGDKKTGGKTATAASAKKPVAKPVAAAKKPVAVSKAAKPVAKPAAKKPVAKAPEKKPVSKSVAKKPVAKAKPKAAPPARSKPAAGKAAAGKKAKKR